MLKQLIRQIPGWKDMILTELTDYLNVENIEVKDEQLYTWAGIALLAGPVNAEYLKVALEQNNLSWAVHQLGGTGLQLSNPLIQQVLLSFHQAGIPGCLELANVGIKRISMWTKAGGKYPISTDKVDEARKELIIEELRESKLMEASREYNKFLDFINSWDGTGEEPNLVALNVG